MAQIIALGFAGATMALQPPAGPPKTRLTAITMSRLLSRLRPFAATIALAAGAAHAQLVVVMAPDAAPLSKDKVAKVYLGQSHELRPLDLPWDTPTRAAFYRAIADLDQAQVRSVWSRIMFTGRGEPPRELPNAMAVKKAVAADPKAIGYIDASAVDTTVKVVLTLPQP